MTGPARASVFDAEAERYAAVRPGYPAALFDRVAEFGGLRAGSRVLEVGPGTGQATLAMARRGWAVTAVELGPRLAGALRAAAAGLPDVPDVRVVTAAFEDWPPPAEPFDAFVCATAFHWLDPEVRLDRAARTLRPGGTLALVATHHVAGGSGEFFTRAQDCYERWVPGTPPGLRLPAEADVPAAHGEVADHPAFTDVAVHRFPRELTYTTAEYIDLIGTYSPTIALSADRRHGLVDCLGQLADALGGRVVKRYLFELVLARWVAEG